VSKHSESDVKLSSFGEGPIELVFSKFERETCCVS